MTDFQQAILRALGRSTNGFGFCTADIAFLVGRQPGHESNRAHSALISRACKELEAAGVIGRLDDGIPIAWIVKPTVKESLTAQTKDGA